MYPPNCFEQISGLHRSIFSNKGNYDFLKPSDLITFNRFKIIFSQLKIVDPLQMKHFYNTSSVCFLIKEAFSIYLHILFSSSVYRTTFQKLFLFFLLRKKALYFIIFWLIVASLYSSIISSLVFSLVDQFYLFYLSRIS